MSPLISVFWPHLLSKSPFDEPPYLPHWGDVLYEWSIHTIQIAFDSNISLEDSKESSTTPNRTRQAFFLPIHNIDKKLWVCHHVEAAEGPFICGGPVVICGGHAHNLSPGLNRANLSARLQGVGSGRQAPPPLATPLSVILIFPKRPVDHIEGKKS